MQLLNVSFNRLGGSIPPQLGNLSQLESLSLNANLFTGEIPFELTGLQQLSRLNLRSNRLEGPIPEGIVSLAQARFLGLSGNRLSGTIPPSLDQIDRSILDLRDNRLSFPELQFPEGTNEVTNPRAGFQNLVAFYPQLALGGGFEVVLQLTNRSVVRWRGRLVLDGGAWPVDRPWAVDQVDQTGEASFPIELEQRATQKLILSSNSALAARGELADSTGVAPAELGIAFHFPVETGTRVFTGMAFRSVRRDLNLKLKDADGQIIANALLESDGALRLQDLFPGVRGRFVGAVEVTSALPFYMTVLRGELRSDGSVQLTSIPATNLVSAGFQMIFPFQ